MRNLSSIFSNEQAGWVGYYY